MKPSSVVLISGGLDSALAFLVARQETEIAYGLTFDYGQKSHDREIQAANSICQHFGIAHRIVSLPFFSELTDHPFFDDQTACPEPAMDKLDG